MSLWSTVKGLFAPEPVTTSDELKDFLASRAAFLVQKSIMEYAQARSNMMFSTLLSEPAFLAAHEQSRWASYPAAFSMVTEMAEGMIRPHAADALALHAALAAIGRSVFAEYALPSGQSPGFWQDASATLDHDLGVAGLGQPKPVHEIPLARAREIFDHLPVHETLRQHDFVMFRNTLRFHMAEIGTEFSERADLKALAQALVP
ncbi:MAG: hypothetical protein AB7F09_24950 [Parvibaculaceae bacterium]